MKILLFGIRGQVGWELLRTLAPLGEVTGHDRASCDLADAASLSQAVRQAGPQVIVNAAAYNAVDRAESEPELANLVNGRAPGILAAEARRAGAALIHYSTDFVFDGEKEAPYTEEDAPNPLSVYGRSKLAGEEAVFAANATALVLRTSWVYSIRRSSFVTKVLAWSRRFPELRIVTDQVGSPTSARMLAEVTAKIVALAAQAPAEWISERAGLYHLGGAGGVSRHAWAKAILAADPNKERQSAEKVLPASSLDFPTPAIRPRYSVLDNSKFEGTFGFGLPEWRTALGMELEPFTG